MTRWRAAAAYGSGLVPVRDGMALEDYRNALDFRLWGTPDPWQWVDELRAQADAASLKAVC